MPSRNSRANGAPLDPYGIYGSRTQARLRTSRRRRQTQKVVLILVVLAVVIGAFALSRWRREKIDVAPARIETGAAIDVAPIFVSATNTSDAALLIANRDGVLFRYDDIESENFGTAKNHSQNPIKKTILLRDDFPLHAPLLAGDKLFVPSESGVLTALLWREKKILWRKKFDDALTAQPTSFFITRSVQTASIAPDTVAPSSISESPSSPNETEIIPDAPQRPATRQVVVAASDAGLVMAIDAGSGQTLWRTRMPASIGSGLTAVEANGRARILVPLLGGTAMRGGVWCLDGATGEVLWRFPHDPRSEAIQFASPLADLPGNRAYFGNDQGAVFALNLTTGTYNAKQKIGWKSFALPVVEDSKNIVLLRATPVLADTPNKQNKLLLIGGNDGTVRALSAGTGSTLWRYQTKTPIVSLLRVETDRYPSQVLVVSQSSQLVLLDAQTGRIMRRLSGHGEIFTGAVVSEHSIFVATESGAIHRFALAQ